MKKLSKSLLVFASAAMILANGFFVSCSNGDDGDSTPTVTTPKPGADNGNNGGNQNGNGSGNNNGNQNGNGNGNGGNNGGTSFTAPDLSTYYKKYFVTTDSAAPNFGKSTDTWGSGSGCEPNSDGTLKLTSAHMWDAAATEGVVAAYNDLTAGVLASYEYIVFTVDTSSFTSTFTSAANDGVNVKLAGGGKEKLITISNNCAKGENNTATYYAKISDFESVPQTANQMALIIGGSGTLTVKEIYAASKDDPASKPVTAISITPATANVAAGKTTTFVVKDSNFVDVTANAVFTLSGAAATGCSVANGVFTAGSTAGEVTVTAKYTVNGSDFTATATVTVIVAATTKKELFDPTSEGFKVDGILPLINTANWGGTNTNPTAVNVNGVDAVALTVPESGITGWIGVAWQGSDNDKISLVGYSSISITVKDEYGEGKSLTSAKLKIKANTEVAVVPTISEPDANGWRTITASLDQYASIDLGAVICIHLADWADNSNIGGKLYVSKVTLNPAN